MDEGSISSLQGIVLCLLAGLIILTVLTRPASLEGPVAWIKDAVRAVINALFRMPTYNDEIAMNSAKALSCAIDTVAAGTGEFVGDSCSYGNEVTAAIAFNAPKRGLMTARVIDAANRITGAAIGEPEDAYQCGYDERTEKTCGLVIKEACKAGERCLPTYGPDDIISAWECLPDQTCYGTPEERAKMTGEAYSCFGSNMHVCVACGQKNFAASPSVVDGRNCPFPPELRCGSDDYIYFCNYGKWERIGSKCDFGCVEKVILGEISPECRSSGPIPYQCQVIGFELPQDVETGSGLFGDVIDFARTWIGAIGEPRYLVYYETFPEGIESTWVYEDTDVIIAAVAIGGVMNLGGGTFKAGASGIKASGKAGLAVVRKAGIKRGIREAIEEASIVGRRAASERLAFEYGGMAALRKMSAESIVKRKLGGSVIAMDSIQNTVDNEMGKIIFRESAEDSMLKKIIPAVDEQLPKHKDALADFSLMIRSDKEITKDSVKIIVEDTKVRKIGELEPHLTDDDYIKLTGELNSLRNKREAGELIDEDAEEAMMNAIKTELEKTGVLWDKTKKSYWKIVSEEEGKLPKMKKLVQFKAIREEREAIYNKEVNDVAVGVYEDIVSKARQLPGSVDDATTARGMLMKHFEDAWAEVYEAEGKTDAMKEILTGLDERSTALAKGVPYGNTWSLDKRKKLMFAALVASYIAMDTEANLEKYATCGSGTMCLHFPLFFGEDNNRAYGLGEELMSEYKGLVVTKYPGAKTDRFHLMSPCKTDLTVEAHEADGFCKCEELYTADEVVYRMQKIRCMAKGLSLPVPINGDGTCPEKYTYAGTEYEVEMDSDKVHTHIAGEVTFSCDPDEDQEACVHDFMYMDGCANLDPIFCLYEEYKDCYCADCPNPSSFCFDDLGASCDTDGNCVGFINKPSYTVPLSNTQDTFAVPINLKENVNEDGLTAFEPVTVCTNSWASEFLGSAKPDYFFPCVSVAYDTVSMRGYSKGGFGVNYCAENKADFKDTLEKTCFWGGIAGAVAVSAFSGGVTGTVLLPVAIGSGSVACEKIMNMDSKWPHDQY